MGQSDQADPQPDPVHPDTQPLAASHHTLSGHALAPLAPGSGPRVGMMLGPYQLLEPLGQGGMGQVWLARQTAPLKREVAVKLLSRSLDDRIAEAWFLVERQALAMLMHPYIAQIYDAGQLPGGLMFLAMELVDGQTLDRWVCERLPTLPRLTELFERICQGVQHAHQRGLIHRDLKPANILVSEQQGEPLPKIIDFGVAIGVGSNSASTAGTRAYMAPEQAQPDGRGIDARADVYGLGATLAALLCLQQGIRADGSTALSHLHAADQASSLSRQGGSVGIVTAEQVQRLRRAVPRALRSILLKATAATREQRYDSAAALAEDLRRWRSGHPVQAMGGGRGYAIGCFLRRHRWASAAAGVALLALLGGITVALYGLTQARSAQALAEQRRVQAEGLVGVMLGDLADKLRPLGRLDLLETVGEEAMRYLGAAQASGDAGAIQRARALRTLGEVYLQRQQIEQAVQAFAEAERTLAGADPQREDPADLLFEQGNVAFWLGNLDLQDEDYPAAQRHFADYLRYAEALQALTTDSGLGELETSYALNNLGTVASRQGRTREAIDYYQRSVALKRHYLERHPDDDNVRVDLADSLSWIGSALAAERRPAEAKRYYEEQVALTSSTAATRSGEAQWLWMDTVAKHILALLELSIGDGSGLNRLRNVVPAYATAVSLDPSNMKWTAGWLGARADLAWAEAHLDHRATAIRELSELLVELPSLGIDESTAKRIQWRAKSMRDLLLALEGNCAEPSLVMTGPDISSAQGVKDAGPRERAYRLIALAVCQGMPSGASLLEEASSLANSPQLFNGDEGLQIAALSAAILGERARLNRLRAQLDGLGYDAGRAERLLHGTID